MKAHNEQQRDFWSEHPYGGHAPSVGSTTSKAAADHVEGSIATKRLTVLAAIQKRGGQGYTDDELERRLGMCHQSLSARRRELVLLNQVKDSGKRRLTRSGRSATVWVVA